jgi:hypothetical protein
VAVIASFPIFAALVAVTTFVGVRLWALPNWYLAGALDTALATNEYRAALGPIFAGLLQGLGGAAIFYGLWLNYREQSFTRMQHLSQRLKDAIVQLESDHPSTRIAALRELEEIAKTDESRLGTIVEALRLHVRNRAAPADYAAPVRGRLLPDDVLTAIGVVTRLQALKTSGAESVGVRFRLDLRGADLRGLPLGDWIHDARLDDVNLDAAHFSGQLRIAAPRGSFRGALFSGVTWYPNVDGGGVAGADFSGARFEGSLVTSPGATPANLRGVVLDSASFDGTLLSRCDLTGAFMRNCRFENGSAFDYNLLENAQMDGTTFTNSRVHPWQLQEFVKARSQPANYGASNPTAPSSRRRPRRETHLSELLTGQTCAVVQTNANDSPRLVS